MGELAKEYEGRVVFEVIPAAETSQRSAEIASLGFTELRHGLVGFGPDGEVLAKLPGHDYDKAEIEAVVETLLATSER